MFMILKTDNLRNSNLGKHIDIIRGRVQVNGEVLNFKFNTVFSEPLRNSEVLPETAI